MGSLDMKRLIVFALVLACVAAVKGSITEKKPFSCLGFKICNWNDTDWQYCDETGEKRCRLCSKDKDTCFTAAMPRNCTAYCKERLIELERVKGCPPLNSTTHGHHNGSGTGTSYGETVQLECEAGYQCEGSCTVTCGEFGQYSGSPRCTENRCRPLFPPRNGHHSPVQHNYGMDEHVQFRCNEGFELEGDANATCTADGTWSISKMAACTRPLKQGNATYQSWVAFGIGIPPIIALVLGFMLGLMYATCRRKRESKHSDLNTSDSQTNTPLLSNRHETRDALCVEDEEKGNLPDKFPTEASPDKDGGCHGELQAHTMEHVDSVKPDQIKDQEETLSVHSLGFSAQEQVKIPPRDNMHAQPAGQSSVTGPVDDGNHPRMDDTLPKGVVISSDHSNGSTSNTGSPVQELNKIQPCKNMHCQPEEQSDTCMQKP